MGFWTSAKRKVKEAPARYRAAEHERLRADIDRTNRETQDRLEMIQFRRELMGNAPKFIEERRDTHYSRGESLNDFVDEFMSEYTDEGRERVWNKWMNKLMYGRKGLGRNHSRASAHAKLTDAIQKALSGEEV